MVSLCLSRGAKRVHKRFCHPVCWCIVFIRFDGIARRESAKGVHKDFEVLGDACCWVFVFAFGILNCLQWTAPNLFAQLFCKWLANDWPVIGQ